VCQQENPAHRKERHGVLHVKGTVRVVRMASAAGKKVDLEFFLKFICIIPQPNRQRQVSSTL